MKKRNISLCELESNTTLPSLTVQGIIHNKPVGLKALLELEDARLSLLGDFCINGVGIKLLRDREKIEPKKQNYNLRATKKANTKSQALEKSYAPFEKFRRLRRCLEIERS